MTIIYRLSTVQAADRIIVMDGGKIVEVCFLDIHLSYAPTYTQAYSDA